MRCLLSCYLVLPLATVCYLFLPLSTSCSLLLPRAFCSLPVSFDHVMKDVGEEMCRRGGERAGSCGGVGSAVGENAVAECRGVTLICGMAHVQMVWSLRCLWCVMP